MKDRYKDRTPLATKHSGLDGVAVADRHFRQLIMNMFRESHGFAMRLAKASGTQAGAARWLALAASNRAGLMRFKRGVNCG